MAAHHYAIDAAKLLGKCHASLVSILDYLEERSNNSFAFRRRALQLIELNDGENILALYLLCVELHSMLLVSLFQVM
jgi:hypothetical protein